MALNFYLNTHEVYYKLTYLRFLLLVFSAVFAIPFANCFCNTSYEILDACNQCEQSESRSTLDQCCKNSSNHFIGSGEKVHFSTEFNSRVFSLTHSRSSNTTPQPNDLNYILWFGKLRPNIALLKIAV